MATMVVKVPEEFLFKVKKATPFYADAKESGATLTFTV